MQNIINYDIFNLIMAGLVGAGLPAALSNG
jgi:hypothetical protein